MMIAHTTSEGELILLALISKENVSNEDFSASWKVVEEAEIVVEDLGAGRPWYRITTTCFGSVAAKISPLLYDPRDVRDDWYLLTGHKCPLSVKELTKRAAAVVAG